MQPSPLIITKSIERSSVHRRVQEDYIGIKRFDSNGQLIGERRFIGLFTSSAYNESPRDIPFLRRKVANATARAALPKSGHRAKALAQVLETFPRDELFQISDEDLLRIAPGIAYLSDRPRTKAFLRFDTFDRFASALVYFPADKFRGGLIRTLGKILTDALGGKLGASYPHTEEGQLTRIHYMIDLEGGRRAFDEEALQAKLEKAVRLWSDDFSATLHATLPGERADNVFARYAGAFSEGYRETFGAQEAIADIAKIEEVHEERRRGPGAALVARRRRDRRHGHLQNLSHRRRDRAFGPLAGARAFRRARDRRGELSGARRRRSASRSTTSSCTAISIRSARTRSACSRRPSSRCGGARRKATASTN